MNYLVRFMLCLMITTTLVEWPIMKAHAATGMISTSEVVTQMTRAESQARVAEVLNRGDIQQELVKMGISPEEANRRIAGLSDAEARNLASDLEEAQAGGSIGGILVLVLLVVLIIYLVKRI